MQRPAAIEQSLKALRSPRMSRRAIWQNVDTFCPLARSRIFVGALIFTHLTTKEMRYE
jgi:hypothetical protein